MFCGKCGTKNVEGSFFCIKCGNQLQVAEIVKEEQQTNENFQVTPAPKKSKVGKWVKTIVWFIVFLIVAVSTRMIVNDCMKKLVKDIDSENVVQAKKEKISEKEELEEIKELEELTADEPVVEGLYEATDKPRNAEMVRAFTQKYGGVWYLTKEYTDQGIWQYHDLGKKLMIFAWNRFNDYSSRDIVGTYEESLGQTNYYYNGKIIATEDWGTRTRFIYGETKHYDGFDIKYNEKFIVLTDYEVDLTGIGGPIFSMEDFRYENIRGYDYLISDIYGFGLVWDGDYLEYCEPNKNGNYQGQYAFRSYSLDSVIGQDYNDDWN